MTTGGSCVEFWLHHSAKNPLPYKPSSGNKLKCGQKRESELNVPDETSIPLLPVMFLNCNRNMMEPWYNHDVAQLHLVDVMGNGRCEASASISWNSEELVSAASSALKFC